MNVDVHPAIEPRLVLPGCWEREDRAGYERRGGYGAGTRGDALIAAIAAAGLRGRGGAAFPAGIKLRAVAEREGPRSVVANGEEGEPASVKDRWLLRVRPHLVLDGLFLAATAVGASRAYVYLSDADACDAVEAALAELDEPPVATEVVMVDAGYVAGEETSVVRAINGGPPKPTAKPPRPFEEGVDGRPTLVSNVETLANVPFIATRGARAFRAVGHPAAPAGPADLALAPGSPGTFLLTVSGACERPGLYEVPLGAPLGRTLELLAGLVDVPSGFLMGGFFAGLLGPEAHASRLDYDGLRADGSGLGCGAIVVLGAADCPVAVAAEVMAYFARENAKQCGACIKGTAAMRDVLASLSRGTADAAGLERLERWSVSLRGRGACATLDGAATLAASLLREFPQAVASHRDRGCDRCPSGAAVGDDDPACRFAVRPPSHATAREERI